MPNKTDIIRKFLPDKVTDIINSILLSRGIDVWRDYQNEDNNNYEITAAIDDIIDMIDKGVDLFE